MHRHRRLFSSLLALGVIAGTVAVPAAEACGGFFCARTPIDQAGERILFVQDGEEVSAYVQIQYTGTAEKFSWVVPTPAEPKLTVGSDALFTSLRNATRPQFNLNLTTEGDCKERFSAGLSAPQATSAGTAKGVEVISQQQVGPYDSAVIQSNDPGALKAWLRENDYDIPAKLDPLLDPYVTGKYYFVALKLQQDRGTGDLQPIVLKYKATKPGIPIRLTGIAATTDMDVYVWVLGKNRAIPENFRHAQINEARIDWLTAGSNYRQVVTEAMNESGGQAFVTDYAGASNTVSTTQYDSIANLNTARLSDLAEPRAFVSAIMSGSYFDQFQTFGGRGQTNTRLYSFLNRHVPKPVEFKDVDDATFYNSIANASLNDAQPSGEDPQATGAVVTTSNPYLAALQKAQFAVDTAKAIQELDETIVQPAKDIKAMFVNHPYMTALYTTLSPDEMTQDPTFLFNPDLPKVANVHTATGVRECGASVEFSDAPIKITLSNGMSFYATRSSGSGTGGTALNLPAALRIEQMKTSGKAATIKDNAGAIGDTLAALSRQGQAIAVSTTGGGSASAGAGSSVSVSVPFSKPLPAGLGGFGCAGCAQTNAPAPPVERGAGEGLTYALVVLGFFGYRRWLGRK